MGLLSRGAEPWHTGRVRYGHQRGAQSDANDSGSRMADCGAFDQELEKHRHINGYHQGFATFSQWAHPPLLCQGGDFCSPTNLFTEAGSEMVVKQSRPTWLPVSLCLSVCMSTNAGARHTGRYHRAGIPQARRPNAAFSHTRSIEGDARHRISKTRARLSRYATRRRVPS